MPPFKLLKGRDIVNDIDPLTKKVLADHIGWHSKSKSFISRVETYAVANGDVIPTTLQPGTSPSATQIVQANDVLGRAMVKVYQFAYSTYSAERRASFRVGEFKCLTLHGRMFTAGKRTASMASSEPEHVIVNTT